MFCSFSGIVPHVVQATSQLFVFTVSACTASVCVSERRLEGKRHKGKVYSAEAAYMHVFSCISVHGEYVCRFTCGSLYIHLCVCVYAGMCLHLTLQSPLSTPLHVFFSSVNSWLLEQNNCHFPASGSKVIQHNEMYKKEGEMADRRHAKSNVERSE